MNEDIRHLIERGASAARDVDLVSGVWRESRRRRRNRNLRVGSLLAAGAALVFALTQSVGTGGDAAIPAHETTSDETISTTEEPAPGDSQLAANQWFIDEVRKGVQVDFVPMSSPDWAMTQDAVLTGRVSIAAQRGPQVKVTLDVTDSLTGREVPEQVEFLLRIGPLSELTDEKLSAVGGDALLVVRSMGDSDDPAAVLEVPPDGLWLSVPGGLAGPHIDYSDMPEAWPEVSTLEELETVLASRAGSPPPPPGECSAAYQNPPFVNDTGLTEKALSSVDEVFGLAMACDEDGLLVRALADGTQVVVGDGTLAEQLVTPDPSGAYLALAAAVTSPPVTTVTDDGELHTYRLDGWTVVFDQDGRWLEFTGP